jgi:hypothetical protein
MTLSAVAEIAPHGHREDRQHGAACRSADKADTTTRGSLPNIHLRMEQNGAPEHDASGHCPRGNLCDSAGCLLQSSPQICNSGDCFPAVHFAVITGQIIYILKRLVTKKNVTVVRAQASPHGDTLITKIRSGYGFHRILILR